MTTSPRRGAGLRHVEDAGALRLRLIAAQDPELVTLVGRVRRKVVEEDDRAALLRLEENLGGRGRRDLLAGERDRARVARRERRHLGAELLVARREELILAGEPADLGFAAVDLLARDADRQLAPAPQREEENRGGHPPAAAVEPIARIDDV